MWSRLASRQDCWQQRVSAVPVQIDQHVGRAAQRKRRKDAALSSQDTATTSVGSAQVCRVCCQAGKMRDEGPGIAPAETGGGATTEMAWAIWNSRT